MIFFTRFCYSLLQCVHTLVLRRLQTVLARVLLAHLQNLVEAHSLIIEQGENLGAAGWQLVDALVNDAYSRLFGILLARRGCCQLGLLQLFENVSVWIFPQAAYHLAVLRTGEGHQEGGQQAGHLLVATIVLPSAYAHVAHADAPVVYLHPQLEEGVLEYLLSPVLIEEHVAEVVVEIPSRLPEEPFLHPAVVPLQAFYHLHVGVVGLSSAE